MTVNLGLTQVANSAYLPAEVLVLAQGRVSRGPVSATRNGPRTAWAPDLFSLHGSALLALALGLTGGATVLPALRRPALFTKSDLRKGRRDPWEVVGPGPLPAVAADRRHDLL